MSTPFSLQQLGWRNFHSQQLTLEDLKAYEPARIASVHRSGVAALNEQGHVDLVVPRDMQRDGVAAVLTVGDWVLVERGTPVYWPAFWREKPGSCCRGGRYRKASNSFGSCSSAARCWCARKCSCAKPLSTWARFRMRSTRCFGTACG